MGTTENTKARFSCSIQNCGWKFASQRDLTRHEDEDHGNLKRCLRDGCQYSGVSSADGLGRHIVKEHSEKVLSASIATFEVQASSSDQHQSEARISSQVQGVRDIVNLGTAGLSDAVNQSLSQTDFTTHLTIDAKKLQPSSNVSSQHSTKSPKGPMFNNEDKEEEIPTFKAQPTIFKYSPLPKGSYPRIFEKGIVEINF